VIAKRQRVYNWSEKDEEYQRKWRLENQDKIKGYRRKYRQGMIIKALAMGLTPWKYMKMRGWENWRLKKLKKKNKPNQRLYKNSIEN
jgi:hypothetical protein